MTNKDYLRLNFFKASKKFRIYKIFVIYFCDRFLSVLI